MTGTRRVSSGGRRCSTDAPATGHLRAALGALALGAAMVLAAPGSPSTSAATQPEPPVVGVFGAPLVEEPAPGERRWIVLVEDGAALGEALAAAGGDAPSVWESGLVGFAADLDTATAMALRDLPGVTSVEPDRTLRLAVDQSDPRWGLDRIDQRSVTLDDRYVTDWTGEGVTAYVVDSGIWLNHQEFTGRIAQAVYWTGLADGAGPWDCHGHGTHVSGILGGTIYGVAKQVEIVSVKILACNGSGPLQAFLDAVAWILADHQAGEPAVVNLSLGGPASPAADAAVAQLLADGIVVVIAAGNGDTDTCTISPARVQAAITVAASDISDVRAGFSNYGSCNDLFAPGVGILSAYKGSSDASAVFDGTSMAAPHVAGAAALLLQQHPTWTQAQVWNELAARATTGAVTGCCGDPDRLLHVGSDGPPTPPPAVPALVTVQPHRLADTRPGGARVGPGSVTPVQVGGHGGVPVDATAAALNITVAEPAAAGYVTAFPCGGTVPEASNVNFRAGQAIPNAAIVRLDAAGRVCLFSDVSTHLVVDVNGYVPAASDLDPLSPARLFDSRSGMGFRPAGSVTPVTVAGRGGVPAGAAAAVLNVTVADAQADGYLTVFPCGEQVPVASNLNFRAGQTIANAVVARLGAGGAVCAYASAPVHLLVDVNGAVPSGSTLVGLAPSRLLDTRTGATPGAGSVTPVTVAGRGGVPAGAVTVIVNVTAADARAQGYVTAFPCGTQPPVASNLNHEQGDTIANAVVARLGTGGALCIYTDVPTDLIVDVAGYVSPT